MRLSNLFGKTLRQIPAEAETPSHRFLLQAGMVMQMAAGIYSYLPLGWRAIRNVDHIIREEMNAIGGQEIMMPAIHPEEMWEVSGRNVTMDDILFRLSDKRGRQFVLGPTHEEVIVELFKRQVRSYRDLPVLVYQIQQKFRDEPRPRGGLIRLRQFTMKDMYSFHSNWANLEEAYERVFAAYQRIYERCGVPTVPVIADSGAMGGRDTHEFIYLTDFGEDSCLFCDSCGYAANADTATFVKESASMGEDPKPTEEIATPGLRTIDQLATYLQISPSRTAKAVFYSADGEAVLIAIRGDMEVSQTKLKRLLGATDLHYMDEEEVESAGFVAGSASPVGLKGIRIVCDDLIARETNLVAGANKPDRHILNVNYGRDWQAAEVADIAVASAGHLCPKSKHSMDMRMGIEMGHVFKLGTFYSEKLAATFLDKDGTAKPAIMGCYGIGSERLLAAIVEENHDDRGIIWPHEIAPFPVHIVALHSDPAVVEAADRLRAMLSDAGIDSLYDDREETAGVKFKDADLLGMPLRVTISPRSLKSGGVELKNRKDNTGHTVALEDATKEIARRIQA